MAETEKQLNATNKLLLDESLRNSLEQNDSYNQLSESEKNAVADIYGTGLTEEERLKIQKKSEEQWYKDNNLFFGFSMGNEDDVHKAYARRRTINCIEGCQAELINYVPSGYMIHPYEASVTGISNMKKKRVLYEKFLQECIYIRVSINLSWVAGRFDDIYISLSKKIDNIPFLPRDIDSYWITKNEDDHVGYVSSDLENSEFAKYISDSYDEDETGYFNNYIRTGEGSIDDLLYRTNKKQ